jgi:hypothetical protein
MLGKSILVAIAASLLAGCQAWYRLGDQSIRSIAAQELDLQAAGLPQAGQTVDPGQIKDQIGTLVNQSEQKCARFLNGLVLFETSTNTSLDITTTILSALGTAFTPINTVHALTAASSISSGTKTALDADIYAKASIANFSQAIQSTYYSDMGKYVDSLSTADPNTLIWPIQVYKIETIHRECALAPAEASITAALQPTAAQPTTKLAISYTVTPTDKTLSALATSIVNAANNAASFQGAGVTATLNTPASVLLTYPSTTTIFWSSSATAAGGSAGTEHISSTTTAGSATFTLSGSPTAKDVITITGSLVASGTASPTPSNKLAPAVQATTQPSVVPGHKP